MRYRRAPGSSDVPGSGTASMRNAAAGAGSELELEFEEDVDSSTKRKARCVTVGW